MLKLGLHDPMMKDEVLGSQLVEVDSQVIGDIAVASFVSPTAGPGSFLWVARREASSRVKSGGHSIIVAVEGFSANNYRVGNFWGAAQPPKKECDQLVYRFAKQVGTRRGRGEPVEGESSFRASQREGCPSLRRKAPKLRCEAVFQVPQHCLPAA
jgi:hypothetical protein